MKKIAIIALLLIVSACSKSEDSTSGNSIFGKWELYSITEDGYDEFDGTEEYFPTIEFIPTDTYRLLGYDNDGTVSDIIGTFTLAGDILTLTETYFNGESVSRSPDLYVDIEITKNTMKWGERYDDGYDSGYATYHFRKVK
jgi:hypothetical protein